MEEKLLYNLNLLNKMIGREFIFNNKEFFEGDVSPTQMIIMDYILNHQDEDIFQRDLEKVLHLRRATVSGVLQTMEKHDLVERVLCEEDVRCKKIKLKEKAKLMFEIKKHEFIKIEDILKKGLKDDEIILFCHIIERMQNNMKEYERI